MAQISTQDLGNLRTLLDNNDRAGFCLYYYNVTSSRETLLQAHVATYSGFFGGSELFANAVAKFSNPTLYNLSLKAFSTRIAEDLI
jgi:hypothetical protein